jgi:MFS family permease
VIVWSSAAVILGHLHGFLAPAILLVIATPFMATVYIAVAVVFGDLSAGSTRGVTMGMYGTVLFVGLTMGPLLFGPLVQAYGYAVGFTTCAVVAVALVFVMAAFQAEPLRRRAGAPMPPASPGP